MHAPHANRRGSVVGIETTLGYQDARAAGTGIVISSTGLVLTNNHVIESNGTLTVTLNDGREFPGRVASTDPAHDLAVVKIDGTGFPTIAIGT